MSKNHWPVIDLISDFAERRREELRYMYPRQPKESDLPNPFEDYGYIGCRKLLRPPLRRSKNKKST